MKDILNPTVWIYHLPGLSYDGVQTFNQRGGSLVGAEVGQASRSHHIKVSLDKQAKASQTIKARNDWLL